MNRRYSSSDYEKCVGILRHYYENPAITTDIIVGFPGETEEEFSASYEFAKKSDFQEYMYLSIPAERVQKQH